MPIPDVVVPIIHLNGSSREALIEQLREVAWAVQKAQEALAQAYPHQRDYYPKDGLYEQAKAQHEWRRKQLADLQASIEAETEQLYA